MIDTGNFPGNSARYYGLQSSPPVPYGSTPIIGYGTYGQFLANSSEQMTIQENLSQRIMVQPFLGGYDLQVGWIVEIYGGDQNSTSQTSIQLIAQQDKVIQLSVGQTGKTFRAGQTISLTLNTDASKNMVATIQEFNPSTGVMVIDVFGHEGEGTYPQAGNQNWRIRPYGTTAISEDYMLARVTNVELPANSGQSTFVTFQAYQSFGQGTYTKWLILPQWNRAYNYVRNPNHSAYDASIGPSTDPSATFSPYAGETTRINVVTQDSQLMKSGYTEITAKGLTVVYEDEHDISRPYLGRQVTIKNTMSTGIETTVITYDQFLNPTAVTTINESESPLSASHTFSDQDFVFNNQPGVKYFPGLPAVYTDGVLTAAPTPSYYVRDDQGSGSITYKSFEYEQQFQKFTFGDPPEEYILPVLIKNTGRGIIAAPQDTEPSPD